MRGDDLLTLIAQRSRRGGCPEAPERRQPPRRVFDALRREAFADAGGAVPLDGGAPLGARGRSDAPAREMDGRDAPGDGRLGWGRRRCGGAHQRSVDQLCDGGESKAAAVWSTAQKASVRHALLASGKPWATESADNLSAEMDRYVHEWAFMHRDACEATSVRHEQSAALLDLRMQCLSERLEQVRSVVTLLSQSDETLLARAPKARVLAHPTPGLDIPDTKALSAPVCPCPAIQPFCAEVEQARAALTRVKAMNELGHYAEADKMARALTLEARRLRYESPPSPRHPRSRQVTRSNTSPTIRTP